MQTYTAQTVNMAGRVIRCKMTVLCRSYSSVSATKSVLNDLSRWHHLYRTYISSCLVRSMFRGYNSPSNSQSAGQKTFLMRQDVRFRPLHQGSDNASSSTKDENVDSMTSMAIFSNLDSQKAGPSQQLSQLYYTTPIELPSDYPEPPEGCVNMTDNGAIIAVQPVELYESLRRLNSESVLETFAASHASMDKVHFALCLKRLFTIHHRLKGDIRRQFAQTLQEDVRFQTLCAVIVKKGPHFQPSLTFDMFRFFKAFGFHDDHPAVQIYLQLLKHLLNDLHLDQLMQLSNIISRMTSTKNTTLILEGVRALVPSRRNEIMSLSLWDNLTIFDLYHKQLNPNQHAFILNQIHKELGEKSLQRKQAVTLLRLLGKLCIEDEILVQMSVATVEKNLKYYATCDIQDVIKSLRTLQLYCPDILNKIGHMVIDPNSDWLHSTEVTAEDRLGILDEFSQISHTHSKLLDCIIDEVNKNCNSSLADLMSVLNSVACFGSRSPHVMDIGAQILEMSKQSLLQDLPIEDMLELCCSLVVLDIDLPSEITSCISGALLETLEPPAGETVQLFTPKSHGGYCISMQEALAILSIHCPALLQSGLKPNFEVKPQKTAAWGLQYCVENLLEGATVSAQTWLSPGLFLDYTVGCMNSDGVSKTSLAVKVFPVNAFTRNQQKLKGLAQIYISAIQHQGYSVVVINPRSWHSVAEKERPAYLKHKVQRTISSGEKLLVV